MIFCVKKDEGNFVYGEGPFTSSDEPAESGVSFYLNNYDLTNQNPWLIPNSWRLLDKTDITNFRIILQTNYLGMIRRWNLLKFNSMI